MCLFVFVFDCGFLPPVVGETGASHGLSVMASGSSSYSLAEEAIPIALGLAASWSEMDPSPLMGHLASQSLLPEGFPY